VLGMLINFKGYYTECKKYEAHYTQQIHISSKAKSTSEIAKRVSNGGKRKKPQII
jgi:hypothetical protein